MFLWKALPLPEGCRSTLESLLLGMLCPEQEQRFTLTDSIQHAWVLGLEQPSDDEMDEGICQEILNTEDFSAKSPFSTKPLPYRERRRWEDEAKMATRIEKEEGC